jgi:hypothetical protein
MTQQELVVQAARPTPATAAVGPAAVAPHPAAAAGRARPCPGVAGVGRHGGAAAPTGPAQSAQGPGGVQGLRRVTQRRVTQRRVTRRVHGRHAVQGLQGRRRAGLQLMAGGVASVRPGLQVRSDGIEHVEAQQPCLRPEQGVGPPPARVRPAAAAAAAAAAIAGGRQQFCGGEVGGGRIRARGVEQPAARQVPEVALWGGLVTARPMGGAGGRAQDARRIGGRESARTGRVARQRASA